MAKSKEMGPIQQPEEHAEGMAETGHHMWHEILEAFGPVGGILFVAACVLIGIYLWRKKK